MAWSDGTILASLTAQEREALAARAERRLFRRGATILWRGEILTRFYLLETGRASAEYKLTRTRAELALQAGDFFGEQSLEPDATSEAVVRAAEESIVLALPADLLREVLGANAEAARAFLGRVDARRITLYSSSGVLRDLPNMN